MKPVCRNLCMGKSREREAHQGSLPRYDCNTRSSRPFHTRIARTCLRGGARPRSTHSSQISYALRKTKSENSIGR